MVSIVGTFEEVVGSGGGVAAGRRRQDHGSSGVERAAYLLGNRQHLPHDSRCFRQDDRASHSRYVIVN